MIYLKSLDYWFEHCLIVLIIPFVLSVPKTVGQSEIFQKVNKIDINKGRHCGMYSTTILFRFDSIYSLATIFQ